MRDRSRRRDDRPLEQVDAVHLELLRRHDLGPLLARGEDRLVAHARAVRGLDRAAVGVVALEVRGVDLEAADEARRAERDQDPVVARHAAAPRLPAVAHVLAPVGSEDDPRVAVMSVRIADHVPAVHCRRQLEHAVAVLGIPADGREAVDAEARDAAVREDVEPHVAVDALVRDGQEVVRIPRQRRRWQDLGPLGGLVRSAGAESGLDRGARREIAGEEARVDVEQRDPAACAQPHDAPVVRAAVASPPCLPAVHPLAVVVVLVGDEDRRAVLQHALLGAEELVVGEDRFGPEGGRGEIERSFRHVGRRFFLDLHFR